MLASTLSFFIKPTDVQWKAFPESNLKGSKYAGHQVRFFTMKSGESLQADVFLNHLKIKGFDAEMKKAKDKPSIIVDLTTSSLIL